ncbi:MAG TPA: ABC transporter ATP-binding protein, partial [Polyangiaceae bacterium]|nr:ABC transporter ATP-binding protein [Polyangiaceae bacterium]
FAARLRRVAKADLKKRVDDAIEMTELGDVRRQLVGTLSHGYRQRVGIAQAIVHRPEFVVLDEPIGGLDPVQIVEMRELVRSLRGAHTVIVSSHILSEVSETCDRIFVIEEGRIAWSGTEKQLAAEFGAGMQIELTVRAPSEARVLEVLRPVPGVQSSEIVDPSEIGSGVLTLRIASDSDVREAVCRALVTADIAILQLLRRKELESMVLKLLGGDDAAAGRRTRRRHEREAEAAHAHSGAAASVEAT